MYTTYDNLVLGTIAGVKKKLSSPEIARGIIKINDTPIGITADATTDVVTTGVAHGFTSTDEIGFVNTGGLLPAPLVAGTGYYPVNITATTFKVATVVGGTPIDLTTAGTGTNTVYRNSLDLQIQQALDDTKATTLKNHLLTWLRDVNPDTIEKWTALRAAHFVKFRPRLNMDKFPLYGMFGYGDTQFSNIWVLSGFANSKVPSLTLDVRQKPQTFYTDTLPVNGAGGTLEGVATYGDRLIYSSGDNYPNILYVNRKSNDTNTNPEPVWDIANYADGLDYLVNPSFLDQPHEYLAIARLFMLGIFQNRPTMESEEKKSFMLDGESFWHNKFIGALYGERDERGRTVIPGVIRLLKVNYSNDGIFGDFEREMAGDEHFGFV